MNIKCARETEKLQKSDMIKQETEQGMSGGTEGCKTDEKIDKMMEG